MREIKFRGRKINTNKWIVGNLGYTKTSSGNSGILVDGKLHIVDAETVGQYTGLKDKNSKEIYEGDVLKVPSINDHVHGNYSYKEVIYRNGTWIAQYIKSEKGQVVPRGYMAGHLIDCYDHDYKALVFYDDRLEHTEIEVVGNIYENSTK